MRMPYITGLVLFATTSGCAEDDKNPPPVNEIEDSGNVSMGMTAGPSTAGDTAGSGTTGGTTGSGSGSGAGTADSTGTGPVVLTSTSSTAGSEDDSPMMTTDQLPSG